MRYPATRAHLERAAATQRLAILTARLTSQRGARPSFSTTRMRAAPVSSSLTVRLSGGAPASPPSRRPERVAPANDRDLGSRAHCKRRRRQRCGRAGRWHSRGANHWHSLGGTRPLAAAHRRRGTRQSTWLLQCRVRVGSPWPRRPWSGAFGKTRCPGRSGTSTCRRPEPTGRRAPPKGQRKAPSWSEWFGPGVCQMLQQSCRQRPKPTGTAALPQSCRGCAAPEGDGRAAKSPPGPAGPAPRRQWTSSISSRDRGAAAEAEEAEVGGEVPGAGKAAAPPAAAAAVTRAGRAARHFADVAGLAGGVVEADRSSVAAAAAAAAATLGLLTDAEPAANGAREGVAGAGAGEAEAEAGTLVRAQGRPFPRAMGMRALDGPG